MFLLISLVYFLLHGTDALSDRIDVFSANDTTPDGTTTYFCIKIPTLLEHAHSGTLIALGEARVNSCADVAWTDLVIRRSTDGGLTWSPLEVLISNSTEENTNVVGNAAPVVDRDTGRIWLPFNRNNQETWITYSDDAGLTWAEPVLRPELQKSEWLWVGVGPPGGIQLSSGRLLIPGYHSEFWPAPDKSSFGSGMTKGHVLLSDDHGETWRLGADDFGYMNGTYASHAFTLSASPPDAKAIPASTASRRYINECQAAELPDGTVVLNSRVFADRRAITFSTDGGESFPNSPVWADGLYETFQGCEGSTIALSNGTLLYSGVQGRTPARIYREDLGLFSSSDGGLSWSRLLTVYAGSSAYSSLALLTTPSRSGGVDGREQRGTRAAGGVTTGVHGSGDGGSLAILFERSDCEGMGPDGCPVVFLPEHISFQVLF